MLQPRSWEVRGCCIAELRLEAVQMEMCLCQGGCDNEEWCPVPTDLLVLPLIQFFHILFHASISLHWYLSCSIENIMYFLLIQEGD